MAEWSNSPKPWVRRGLIVDGSNIRAVLARVQIQVCLREAEGWLGVGNRHQPVSRPAPGLARSGKDWMTTLRVPGPARHAIHRETSPFGLRRWTPAIGDPGPNATLFLQTDKMDGSRCRVCCCWLQAPWGGCRVSPGFPGTAASAASPLDSVPVDRISDFVAPPTRRSRVQVQSSFQVLFSDPTPPKCRAPGFV